MFFIFKVEGRANLEIRKKIPVHVNELFYSASEPQAKRKHLIVKKYV